MRRTQFSCEITTLDWPYVEAVKSPRIFGQILCPSPLRLYGVAMLMYLLCHNNMYQSSNIERKAKYLTNHPFYFVVDAKFSEKATEI